MKLHRPSMIARLREEVQWDVCIIGGGATGLGIAFEAASSGISTLLIERDDFAKGTSSRSTKLLHGGVRYLEQGKIALVKEALRERGPRAAQRRRTRPIAGVCDPRQTTVAPGVLWTWPALLRPAFRPPQMGPDHGIDLRRAAREVPQGRRPRRHRRTALLRWEIRRCGAGVEYWPRPPPKKGAVLVNHCSAVGINKTEGTITGVTVKDHFSGKSHDIQANVVINACGPFGDALCRLDDPHHENRLQPSQGIHLVFDGEVMPGEDAVLIPKTDDGRMLFAVPWMGKVLVGTTDTALDEVTS